MNSVIEISGLVKTFGRIRALDGLDLTVQQGEILGFLGPNGSGKSTTIRVLLGLLRANSGRVTLLGGDPWKDAPELHKRIAYVPGDVALWPNLSGGEVIDVIGRFRGGIDKKRRDELIEAFELDPRKKARTYSKGNRQKVGLIAALASEAELYILDEPTSGLDPLMESVFKREVAKLRVNGVSILLSSHILSEVEQLCDRVSIIRAGRTVESGTLAELRHLTRSTVRASVASVPAGLDRLDGVSDVALDGTKITLQAEAGALDSVMALLAKSGLHSLEVHPPTLEELFMSHYSTADGGSDPGPATGGRGERTRHGRAHPARQGASGRPPPRDRTGAGGSVRCAGRCAGKGRGAVMSTLAGPAEATAAKTGGSSTFTGLWNSVRLIVRRDRVRFALWFGLILLATLGTVAGIPKALPDEASRRVFGQLSNTNPAELLLIGRVFSDSVGGLGAWRVTAYASVGLGLASMFSVLRHTRKEEEEGRREALGGAVLGRNAPLTAAVVVTLLVNALFGVLLALGAIGMGLPAAGSVVWGIELASYGAVMTGVGAVLGQLTNGSRAASGIGSVVLAVFYLGRGVADSQNSDALRWASPYGWIENFRPFASNNIGPLWPIALLTVVLVAVGFLLLTRRDENQGLLPDRSGRATAVRGLAGPFSLALRLNRGVLLGWVIGAGAFGLMISGAAQGATDQISSSPALQGLIRGGKPVDAFFSLIIDLMAEIFTIYAVAVIARLHTEEGQGLAEPVLATRIGRLRWAGGFFTVAAAGVAVVLLATGLGMGLGYGAISGDWTLAWPLVGAVLVRLPAVWVMTGLAAALYGFWPRLAGPVCYALIGVFMLFGIIVQLLSLDPEAMKISPFANVPSLPVAAFDAVPLLWLLLVATVLTLLGVLGLRRRDMHNS